MISESTWNYSRRNRLHTISTGSSMKSYFGFAQSKTQSKMSCLLKEPSVQKSNTSRLRLSLLGFYMTRILSLWDLKNETQQGLPGHLKTQNNIIHCVKWGGGGRILISQIIPESIRQINCLTDTEETKYALGAFIDNQAKKYICTEK